MNALEAAIFTKLAADSTLTGYLGGTAIYNGIAPQGASYPYVIFSATSEIDNYTLAAEASQEFLYTVKAVTKSPGGSPSRKSASQIDERCKAVLNNTTLTISGKTLLSIRRATGFKYDESADGVLYHHVGADYRIWTA